MAKIQVTVECAKETYELADGLATFIATVWPKLRDGVQIGDAGALVAAVIALTPALKGVEQIPAEATGEPEAFAMSGAVMLAKVIKALRA